MASRSPLSCPKCNHSLPRHLLWWSNWWTRWRCEGCDSLLRVNRQGRAVVIIGGFGTALLLGAVGCLLFGPSFVGLSVSFGITMVVSFALWWRYDGWVIVEPVGSHCPHCGYNLAGNISGRCPECGIALLSDTEVR